MKRALVTGGSGDIGSAICRTLGREGVHVIVHAHSRIEHAQQVAADIAASGGSAEAVAFDVTDYEQSAAEVGRLVSDEAIQILVAGAGIHDDAPLAGMKQAQWRRVIDVSLNGFYNVCQPLLLPMMATRWGRVVALSSVSGQIGNRGQANYAGAKAGLHGAIKSLSQEIASRGVTANVVAPGIIRGAMIEKMAKQAEVKNLVPAKRLGEPQEVADLVAFLASDKAAYISGQVIGVNGGLA